MTRNDLRFFEFGDFRFDVRTLELSRSGLRVPINVKAAEVLRLLLHCHGDLVTKEDFLAVVWSNQDRDEQNLPVQIHELRRVLADDAKHQRLIETLTRRGYRFIAPVREISASNADRGPLPSRSEAYSLSAGDGGPISRERRQADIDPVPESSSDDNDRPPFLEPVRGRATGVATPVSTPTAVRPGPADKTGLARPRKATTARWVSGAATLGVLILIVNALQPAEPPVPRVVRTTKLTQIGRVMAEPMATDGHLLAFSTPDGQRVIRIDGKKALPPQIPEDFRLLDISSDGREALATRPADRGAEDGLWNLPLDGRPPHRLGMLLADTSAAWTRDGQRLAYTYQRDLYVSDRAGRNVRKLAGFSANPGWIRWSPDGQFVRISLRESADRRNPRRLVDVEVDSGRSREVLRNSGPSACCRTGCPAAATLYLPAETLSRQTSG